MPAAHFWKVFTQAISFLDPVLSDGQNSSNFDLVLDKEPDHHLQHNSITIQSAALNFDRNRNHSILPSDKTNALVLLRRYWGHQQTPTMCSPNNKKLSNHLYQNNWKISHQDLVDKVTRAEVDLAHLKAWPQLKVVGHLWRRNTSMYSWRGNIAQGGRSRSPVV